MKPVSPCRKFIFLMIAIVLSTCFVQVLSAQEKKNLRMVFVSLAWNSELPYRVAQARGFYKAQGLSIEPILLW